MIDFILCYWVNQSVLEHLKMIPAEFIANPISSHQFPHSISIYSVLPVEWVESYFPGCLRSQAGKQLPYYSHMARPGHSHYGDVPIDSILAFELRNTVGRARDSDHTHTMFPSLLSLWAAFKIQGLHKDIFLPFTWERYPVAVRWKHSSVIWYGYFEFLDPAGHHVIIP